MARIYTKTGDKGETGLHGGGRVSKSDPLMAALGDVDELNAHIGVARFHFAAWADVDGLLARIQNDLFALGASLAGAVGKPPSEIPLEQAIDRLQSELEPLRNFILPGGMQGAAALHVARAVCRRAERSLVALGGQDAGVRYLNRLSDLLFVLGRTANRRSGVSDVKWFSEGNE